jgi:hypothetical protein
MVLEPTRKTLPLETALSDGKLDAKNGMVSCQACGWTDIISFLASNLAGHFSGFQENKVDFGK